MTRKIVAGMDVPLFKQDGRPSVLSVKDVNLLARLAKALANPKIVRGTSDAVYLSDSNMVFQIATDQTGGSTTTPTPIAAPLDAAIYVESPGAGNYIWGVRGGYLYKIDPDTGESLSATRFSILCFGDTSIAYDDDDDLLLVSYWNAPQVVRNNAGSDRTIYTINPSSLAISSIGTNLGGAANFGFTYGGPHQLAYYGGIIYTCVWDVTSSLRTEGYMVRYNMATFTSNRGFGTTSNQTALGGWSQVSIDTDDTNYVWFTSLNGGNILKIDRATLNTTQFVGATTVLCYGMAQVPGGSVYTASRSATVDVISNTGTFITTITLTSSNPYPYRIRYNPYNGLLYVPTYRDDSVVTINPGTNAVVSVFTGFSAPFDCVFTPSHSWAVQHGTQGLMEIT